MKRLVHLAFLLAISTVSAADFSPLKSFEGTFLRSGKVTVSDGSGIAARGKNKIRFFSTSNGTARLKITGELRLNGTPRTFSSIVVFREEHMAAISNLAPGIDDGHSVDEGSYGVGARSIRAEFPYVFGTTPGSVSLFIRIEKHKHATRFRVTQILTSDALTSPITWRFSAVGRP